MDVDEEQVQSEQREENLQHLEAQLLERLEHEGHAALWKTFKTSLHCERFFESPTGKHLVDRLLREIIDAQNEWLTLEPDSAAAIAAHRRALSAKTALFLLDEILQQGTEAEADLRRIELEVG